MMLQARFSGMQVGFIYWMLLKQLKRCPVDMGHSKASAYTCPDQRPAT
jgi:hypothetical protein